MACLHCVWVRRRCSRAAACAYMCAWACACVLAMVTLSRVGRSCSTLTQFIKDNVLFFGVLPLAKECARVCARAACACARVRARAVESRKGTRGTLAEAAPGCVR